MVESLADATSAEWSRLHPQYQDGVTTGALHGVPAKNAHPGLNQRQARQTRRRGILQNCRELLRNGKDVKDEES